MEAALIGLGKMGGAMAVRLVRGGHRIVAHDREPGAVREAVRSGAEGAAALAEAVARLAPPRVVWLMVPAGVPTEETVVTLSGLLAEGDMIVDGGNSDYRDSMRRAALLAARGVGFVDVGTSGGVWGREEGYCLMAGGDAAAVERIAPLLKSLAPAPDRGWAHVGPAGAGHFAKMVHNGVEYALMEAYAEGFDLLAAKKEFAYDPAAVAELWRHGSVVRSWLLDLAAEALAADAGLAGVAPYAADSGEGRWTVREGVELGVALPAITAALHQRFQSQDERRFGLRLVAALRQQFGGHPVKKD